jgi:hypothetical protein
MQPIRDGTKVASARRKQKRNRMLYADVHRFFASRPCFEAPRTNPLGTNSKPDTGSQVHNCSLRNKSRVDMKRCHEFNIVWSGFFVWVERVRNDYAVRAVAFAHCSSSSSINVMRDKGLLFGRLLTEL